MIIVLQTYARTEYALLTVQAVNKHLKCPLRWFIVDDGSHQAHLDAIADEIRPAGELVGLHSQRIGYGALANVAWRETAKHDPLTLWLEDDWALQRDFDPAHYINLLNTYDDIGMVRLACIPTGLISETVGDGPEAYLKLHKGTPYYFSGNPAMRHIKFYEAYGDYPTNLDPGNTELGYDAKIQGLPGPGIVIPVEIGTWGLFGHIGTEQSY